MKEVQFMEEEGRNGPSNTPRSVNSRSTSLHNNHNQLAREEPTQSNKFIKKKRTTREYVHINSTANNKVNMQVQPETCQVNTTTKFTRMPR